jgi:hypothetical protein
MTTNAEWLAWWSANNDVGLCQVRIYCELKLFAPAKQILSVRSHGVGIHLKPNRFKAVSFKSERQSATTGKQIQNKRRATFLGSKQAVDSLRKRLGHLAV